MATDYDQLADACERGEYPGKPGPIFHGLPPAWYGKKMVASAATAADTTAAQLEVANARIEKLERQLAGVRQLVNA
jgi:hypothetical protein